MKGEVMNFETLKARALGLDGRLVEDELYRIVWEEIERGEMDKAAKARATAEAGSDEGQLRGAYIRYRVRRLKDELELYARENKVNPPKAAVAPPMAKGSRQVCSLCGEKLGFFNKTSTSMCKSCHRNVTTTNRR